VRPLVPLAISDARLASLLYLSGPPAGKLPLSWVRLPLALTALLINHLVLGVVMARTRGLPDDALDRYRELCRRVTNDPRVDAVGAIRRLLLVPRLLDPIGHMALFANVGSMRFMPWLGLLKRLLERWAPAVRDDAAAQLTSGSEGVLSAMMGRAIADLAHAAAADPAVRDIIAREEPEAALTRLRQEPAARGFMGALDQFLAVHGHRTLKEFELASPRWEEDPAPVLALVRNHLLVEAPPAGVPHARGAAERAKTTREIHDALQALPLEKTLRLREHTIRFAAARARYYFKLRENSRFYHIMGFGVVRKKILAAESELLRDGKLRCRDDICFLTWDEVTDLQRNRLAWRDVEERVRERRLEHVRLARTAPPRTIGIELPLDPPQAGDPHLLTGFGASPGRCTGVARVILDPAGGVMLHPGEVLVAPYTDPAWTPLFLTAGAAVVEVGSYLSHAGTVAREYGMPCVVDIADCTQRLATGTRVEVDGDRGTVRILNGAAG
jgi:pyruvate,water dikinase